MSPIAFVASMNFLLLLWRATTRRQMQMTSASMVLAMRRLAPNQEVLGRVKEQSVSLPGIP